MNFKLSTQLHLVRPPLLRDETDDILIKACLPILDCVLLTYDKKLYPIKQR